MASTIGLRPPNVSLSIFGKGSDLDNKDKSKPRFRVAEMISLGVWFTEVKTKLGCDRRYSY